MNKLTRFFFSLLTIIYIAAGQVALSTLSPSFAKAADFDSDEGISEADLRASIQKNSKLTPTQIDSLMAILQKQFNVQPDQKIPISGYIFAHGMNVALFVDHDSWNFDATIRNPGSDDLVDIPELFVCDFHNGGLKAELAYKWMFTFIPRGANVQDLDGGVYGRGFGAVAEALLGLEGSWIPAKNRSHDMFHVAVKLGFGAGFVFPKMECKLRVKPAAPPTKI